MNQDPLALAYRRLPTRAVRVGDVGIGGDNPIRVQSMTTPATTDTEATVTQIERLVDAGCEIVRVTVPSKADADNLPVIREVLEERKIRVPLVADIHFTPAAAMLAVEHVHKVRINPGNFADKKQFAQREYTDQEYALELERIAERARPLLKRSKELGVSLRIGTNHGSLSDRIMNRYGDTAQGMVESALEFVRIAEDCGNRELVLSMKSSNPLVCIEAYRLLVKQMYAAGTLYPLHLGVTEAGDAEDGRVKSALGIGALLEDGIGDTVRVSLTEDPVAEVPVAFALVKPYNELGQQAVTEQELKTRVEQLDARPYERQKSEPVTLGSHCYGGDEPPVVEARLPLVESASELQLQTHLAPASDSPLELIEFEISTPAQLKTLAELSRQIRDAGHDLSIAARLGPDVFESDADLAGLVGLVSRFSGVPRAGLEQEVWQQQLSRQLAAMSAINASYLASVGESDVPAWVCSETDTTELHGPAHTVLTALKLAESHAVPVLAGLEPIPAPRGVPAARYLIACLRERSKNPPLLWSSHASQASDSVTGPAVAIGSLLAAGHGDAVRVMGGVSVAADLVTSWSLLQAARLRISKAEFISCPSCGRTLFDLETTTQRIKSKTDHLIGVKIAIMGCIVNGPGEMADADFGYVGWGPGKVSLFVGKDMVEKDISEAEADTRLIELIKHAGRWQSRDSE